MMPTVDSERFVVNQSSPQEIHTSALNRHIVGWNFALPFQPLSSMGAYAPLGNGGQVLGDLAEISSICAHKRIIARTSWGIGDRESAHGGPAAAKWRARGGTTARAHHRRRPAPSLDLPGPGRRKLVRGRLRDEAAEGPVVGWPCPGAALPQQDLQGE